MGLNSRGVSQDVRELGTLLGNILEEQTSSKAFETVESGRQAAIEYRSGERDSREPLIAELEGVSAHNQRIVARAFTTYFELINLAEEQERIRTIREGSHEGPSRIASRPRLRNSARLMSRPSGRSLTMF